MSENKNCNLTLNKIGDSVKVDILGNNYKSYGRKKARTPFNGKFGLRVLLWKSYGLGLAVANSCTSSDSATGQAGSFRRETSNGEIPWALRKIKCCDPSQSLYIRQFTSL